MKKKITVLMLVLAILCSVAVPSVIADEKPFAIPSVNLENAVTTVAADVKEIKSEETSDTEVISDVKTETEADEEVKLQSATEETSEKTAETKEEETVTATAAPEAEAEVEVTATEKPFEKFGSNSIESVFSPSSTDVPVKPEGSAKPEASLKPEGSAKPEASLKPEGSAQPEASAQPESSAQPTTTPSASAAPTATPSILDRANAKAEEIETQTKSVTGTINSISDDEISITVREGVVEEYIYGAPIKHVKAGDSVMITYDPKVGYMERVYEASEEFVDEVKYVDFTISKLSVTDLGDSITNGDLCGLIYNMLVYNEKIDDVVKKDSANGKTEEKVSIVKAAEAYLEKHPEASDTIKVYSSSSSSSRKNAKAAKNSLNKLKAKALFEMGYISEEIAGGIEEKITREDAAVVLAAVYSKHVKSSKSSKAESYSDEKSISSDAKNSVVLLQKAGIMTSEGGSFNPKDEYTGEDAIADIVKIEELF